MSNADIVAERDVLGYPAKATGLPLLGLTVGADGYWSGRFWEKVRGEMVRRACEKVRVVGADSYLAYFDDKIVPPPERREALKRTIDTWGKEAQNNIARLKVGIVGLGSVGCIVAETMARVGIAHLTLIDPDTVEPHNLDRLLYASERDIGKRKVDLATRTIMSHTTAGSIEVTALPMSIHEESAYKAAIDCDILFSCVDRPIGRDVLNHIAYAHLIPVVDGGIAIETMNDQLHSAHWRSHLIGPHRQCMRCLGQYNTSMVTMELDGSLTDPSYIASLPPEARTTNQNVFPFSLSVAAMEVNLMFRYLLARDWWPRVRQQDYRFVTQDIGFPANGCRSGCEFPQRVAKGDSVAPFYLKERQKPARSWGLPALRSRLSYLFRLLQRRR
ncbi:MAG: ThiF family adenylyltransferase [Chloroflexi bacterium]|nr:ThiF family adenylyltransferase [Chloroflexota bacterium]